MSVSGIGEWYRVIIPINDSSAPVRLARSAAVLGVSPSARAVNHPPSIAIRVIGSRGA